MHFVTGIIVYILASHCGAAPIPVTSSSILTTPEKGLFYSHDGFHLGTSNSNWILNSKDSEKQIHYSNRESDSATVMVRANDLEASMNLETYAKKWMKNYSSFGFDLLGARTFNENNNRGMVVDLLSKSKEKQVRQAIYVKDKKAVIITCSDDSKSFLSMIPQCNQIIRNFSWAETTPQTNF